MKQFILRAGRKMKKMARASLFQKTTPSPAESKEQLASQEKSSVATSTPVKASNNIQSTKTPHPAESGKDVRAAVDSKQSKKSRPKPKWSLDDFQVTPMEGLARFHDFDLPLQVMRAVSSLEFKYCTPIQAKALPQVLSGDDLVGKANTGTGKSAVFLIGIIAQLLSESKPYKVKGAPRALIIAPTRELVIQIAKDGRKLAQFTPLRIHAVYGGANYEKQMNDIKQKVTDIVVATPGRLLDFSNKKILSFTSCRIMIIDEADRMLDMGFIPDVRRIISRIPPKEKRQTLLFSATVSDDVKRLAYQWCVKPHYVEAEEEQVAVETINQLVYLVTSEEKYVVLYNLLKRHGDERVIIFANMKSEVRKLSEQLKRNGIDCALLSGDVPQYKREKRLEQFRSGRVKVLVATDVAGRGIHIEKISHVINFTLPYEPEDYVHRIGRTGRAGEEGTSVSFACEEGAFVLPDIEEYIKRTLPCTSPPEELLEPVPEPVKAPSGHKKSYRKRGRSPRKKGGYKGKRTNRTKDEKTPH